MSDVSAQFAAPELVAADPAGWPAVQLPPAVAAKRLEQFQVVIRGGAIADLERHGQSRRLAEVCGVLIGDVARDDRGPFLLIDAIIQGDPATGSAAQVTFTSETWSYIHNQLERRFPNKRIVGWYHTHPGHGVFLSGMDLFIHENFFNMPWQVAMVFDPHSLEHGLFIWKDGKTVRDAFVLCDDAPPAAPAADAGVLTDGTTPDAGHAVVSLLVYLWPVWTALLIAISAIVLRLKSR